jgi:frataxin-like iron-binding protein CyaY
MRNAKPRYTGEQIQWLKVNSNSSCKSYEELTTKFNDHFGTRKSAETIFCAIKRHCPASRLQLTPGYEAKWTQGRKEWLRDNKGEKTWDELAEAFNEHYGESICGSTARIMLCRFDPSFRARLTPNKSFSDEQIQWLCDNKGEKTYAQLTEEFNACFNEERTQKSITAAIYNHLPSKRKRVNDQYSIYTPEQIEWLKTQLNEWRTYGDLAAAFNRKYDCNKSPYALRSVLKKNGCELSPDKRILPVGTERYYDGHVTIKVALPDVWRRKHYWVWESAYGPVPQGYEITFRDSNSFNCDLDNLMLFKRKHILVLKNNGLRIQSPTPEIAAAKEALAEMIMTNAAAKQNLREKRKAAEEMKAG